MTDAEKGKRLAELNAKGANRTAAENQELARLIQGAMASATVTPLPTQAQYKADKEAAAAAATQEARDKKMNEAAAAAIAGGAKPMARPTAVAPEGKEWKQGPGGWVLVDKPDITITPDQMGADPRLKLPPTPTIAPAGQDYTGIGRENPSMYPNAAMDKIENKPAQTAAAAQVLSNANPSQVGVVLDKLKEEENKGGPGFWDVIQAAAAGWGGQVPLYVQKEIKRKEAETELKQAETIAQKQADIRAGETAQEQAFQREQLNKEIETRLKLAGMGGLGGTGRLNLADLGLGGK